MAVAQRLHHRAGLHPRARVRHQGRAQGPHRLPHGRGKEGGGPLPRTAPEAVGNAGHGPQSLRQGQRAPVAQGVSLQVRGLDGHGHQQDQGVPRYHPGAHPEGGGVHQQAAREVGPGGKAAQRRQEEPPDDQDRGPEGLQPSGRDEAAGEQVDPGASGEDAPRQAHLPAERNHEHSGPLDPQRPGPESHPAPRQAPEHPHQKKLRTPKHGDSDGGPGQWAKSPKRGKGVAYQEQVTGIERGTEYSVPANTKSGKVLFDGYKDGKLLDAKDWNKWPIPDKDFSTQSVLSDARKQVQAAKGVPIEWHVSDKGSADLVRSIFKESNLKGIKVIHTPKP
ncbi:hypothetical protein F0U59_23595 [Archangium gephyra]|nr:hypothetical protein F0U59_23595 [Archangium gephyra]